ncbi:MAG: hypothetical protein GY717_03150 [Rhodobacteraceae bacterium]|nr:hypothetical protein [Paracoccaceae bacterium]
MIHSQTTPTYDPAPAMAAIGLARGTEVMTLTGIRPVESLSEGDRIITRAGACPLHGVVRLADERFKLMFNKPQVVFLENRQVNSETGLPFAA